MGRREVYPTEIQFAVQSMWVEARGYLTSEYP